MYPLELTEKVIEHFSHKKEFQIVLFGGGQIEINKLTQIIKKYPNEFLPGMKL